MLNEVDGDELADRFPAMEDERGQPCVDLWIYWSPDIGTLDVSGPEFAHLPVGRDGEPIRDGGGLRRALTAYAKEFSTALGSRRD